MSIFTGSCPALVTPFNEDNTVDYKNLEKHVKFLLENNSDAILVCGTTGESSTLSTQEKEDLISFVVKMVNKKIPVIAGAGSNNTNYTIELCNIAEKSGADALLVITPYYNKTTQLGLIKNYDIISKNTSLPIILYNIPSRTGLNMLPKTVCELSKIKNIKGIKEASGNISQVAEIKNLCGNDFDIYSGNDNEIVPVLSLGGKGVISTLANICPKEVHNMIYDFLNGNIEESRNMQLKMLNLIDALFCEVNPMPVKEALNLIGMNKGFIRPPLFNIEEENKKYLIDTMRSYNLIK